MRILHPGCGGASLPSWFKGWEIVRLDIDESCRPDVVASMVDMGDIGKFDAIYCSHTLEHLYPHDVKKALKEFIRVLNDDAFVMLFVPDLEDVKPDNKVLFTSPGGDICGLDLMYGHRGLVEESPYMAHHTGFTKELLADEFRDAGFDVVSVNRASCHNLCAVAFPKKLSKERATQYKDFFSQTLTGDICSQH